MQRAGNDLPAGCIVCGQVMVRFCTRKMQVFRADDALSFVFMNLLSLKIFEHASDIMNV